MESKPLLTDRSKTSLSSALLRPFNHRQTESPQRCLQNMPRKGYDSESTIHLLSGFPSLAAFIASDRDRTTLIYKRFDELAARNLLYLQSQLAELHAKQRAFDQEDRIADMPTKQCARNFADFETAALQPDENLRQKERWQLVKQVRETMKEYREALLFESTLATLPAPSKSTVRAFREVYYNQADGKGEPFPTLGGHSAALYDDIDDLVALRAQETGDCLTDFAHEYLAFLFPVSTRNIELCISEPSVRYESTVRSRADGRA